MRVVRNLRELKADYKKITRVVAGDTAWSAEALMFLADRVNRMTTLPAPSEKRIGVTIGGAFVGLVWPNGKH